MDALLFGTGAPEPEADADADADEERSDEEIADDDLPDFLKLDESKGAAYDE